jgi:MYXO-CTERM domain-containing protein
MPDVAPPRPDAATLDTGPEVLPMVDAPMARVDAAMAPGDMARPPLASDATRTSDAMAMVEPDATMGTISVPGMGDTVDAAVARDAVAAPMLPPGMDADPPVTVMDDGFIAGGGCGCRAASAPSREPAGAGLLVAAVALLVARRRRR